MAVIDRVIDIVTPLVASMDLSLYDVEQAGPTLRISVQGEAGIGSDELARLTRMISSALDEADPVPGTYTLEVSSPGLERKLRTLEHYAGALGGQVKLKLIPDVDPRRVEGTLTVADADTERITVRDQDGTDWEFPVADIQTARTVFDWAPTPKKSNSKAKRAKSSKKSKNTKPGPASAPGGQSRSAERSAG